MRINKLLVTLAPPLIIVMLASVFVVIAQEKNSNGE